MKSQKWEKLFLPISIEIWDEQKVTWSYFAMQWPVIWLILIRWVTYCHYVSNSNLTFINNQRCSWPGPSVFADEKKRSQRISHGSRDSRLPARSLFSHQRSQFPLLYGTGWILFFPFANISTRQTRAFSVVGLFVWNGLALVQRLLPRVHSDTIYSSLKTSF